MKHEELIDRAQFFSKELLGIPYNYDVRFATRDDEDFLEMVFGKDHVRGSFIAYGYGIGNESYRHVLIKHGVDENDAENAEEAYILLSPHLQRSHMDLNCVLIHELIHHKLWYLGYDFNDGDPDFEKEVCRLKVSSNYFGKHFDQVKKKWIKDTSPDQKEQLQKYEAMYQKYKKEAQKCVSRKSAISTQ